MVGTPDEFELAIRAVTSQVARFVQPRRGIIAEGIGDETLGGQLRTIPIAAGHADSAEVNFTDHANRHWLLVGIEQIDFGVAQRPADMRTRPPCYTLSDRCSDRGFGRAVAIEELSAQTPAID